MVRWTGEMVREFIENEGYQLVSVPNEEWVKAKDKILVSCGKHEPYEVFRNNFQYGSRCAKCSKCYRYNHKEICEEVSKLDENYFVCKDSPEYKNSDTKLKLSCGKHKYFSSWGNFMKGSRCPRCSGKHKHSHNEICKEISKLDSEYSVCEDSPMYKNAHTKLKLYHSYCQNIFYTSWNQFRAGDRTCGCYSKSKNEILIINYLKEKDINFKKQITFDNLKSRIKLRYDFGIYENDKLLFLLEYDGEQHFKPINFSGISQEQAEEIFIKTQYHDKLKNDYAKENNIPLLRIRYDEDTIFVLENYLKGLQLIKEDDIINLTKEEE